MPTPASRLRLAQASVPAIRPTLKWAGGKRWLVPHLLPLWQEYRQRRLVEPFCGGLAVALGLKPRWAVLNDINPHLISFYRWLQRGLQLEIPLKNSAECYYQHRERFNELIAGGQAQSREAAQLFYYLNRTGYNGLCRFNRKGFFNVPFGRHKNIPYQRDLRRYRLLLAGWEFSCRDFTQLALKPDDFIYADPPYDVPFRQYAAQDFSWQDQVRLAEWLAAHPGPVVASNQATARIIELYQDLGFELRHLAGPRRVSCKGDRTPAREILAYKGLSIPNH